MSLDWWNDQGGILVGICSRSLMCICVVDNALKILMTMLLSIGND